MPAPRKGVGGGLRPAGPQPVASCGGYTTPARVRGWETGEPGISGSRETWGLSRLVTPAVVAYVVRMYRVRARLFATAKFRAE